MATNAIYQAKYGNSWALVIGINEYAHCGPLGYARNDAQVVAETLVGKLGFPENNVRVLLDAAATRSAILDGLMSLVDPKTIGPDDRVLVFFAGHGETVTGNRGEVGYLVPTDGDCDRLATLIRWGELTQGADLIPAKHVLFIMDACYGGLAVKRHVAPGSRRFLKDMLRRYARQVLTAGKADEQVADEGGPRAGHSVFTGHLLDALEGAAAGKDGIVTANGVMAYVYDRVAKDHHSEQTPHYGFVDGDGDFVFSSLPADLLAEDATKGKDVAIIVPADLIDQTDPTAEEEELGQLKEYLSEPRFRIKLDDLVSATVRSALLRTSTERFPLEAARITGEDFAARLKNYEEALRPLQSQAVLLGKWASAEQRATLTNMLARMTDTCTTPLGGNTLWLGLRWYPLSLLLYSAGIAALSAENYPAFAALHTKRIDAQTRRAGNTAVPLLVPVVDGMLGVTRTDAWKSLPEYKDKYTPESEYLFKTLQPVLEDLLFLGAGYEQLFDRYEILRALMYADATNSGWGPVGRFGWKYTSRRSPDNPYTELREEAALQQDQWGPLRAGLFRGSYKQFDHTAQRYEAELLSRLNWF